MSPALTTDPASAVRRHFHPALLALAAGGFGIGLTEFIVAGLLSEVAADLNVSIPTAGYLISGYAIAVVVGAFAVTAVLAARPPKVALLVLLGFFLVGNVLSAWAPTYEVILLGRVLAALCHGGFFGIGAVLAADLVAPERQASAIAVMFGGLTAANVLGVPLGTFVGQHLGWRAAFWIICVVGLVTIVGVLTLIPSSIRRAEVPSLRSQAKALLDTQVLLSLLLTVLVFGGLIGAFMYIEPLLTRTAGYSPGTVPWLLVLFGIGLFAGNIAGGRAADRDLDRTLLALAALLPVTLAGLALAATSKPLVAVLLVLMGLVGFAAAPPLQLRVVRYAGDAPTLASAANIGAFNLGNAIGIMAGGAAISAGLGWTSPAWTGAGMAFAGFVVVLTATWALRSPRRSAR